VNRDTERRFRAIGRDERRKRQSVARPATTAGGLYLAHELHEELDQQRLGEMSIVDGDQNSPP
jgi:hypothetical protein